LDLELDLLGHAVHSQIAEEHELTLVEALHAGAAEGQLRVVLHVEEVWADQVLVAVLGTGGDAGGADLRRNGGLQRLVGDGDRAADVVESAANLRHHQVPGDETDSRVGRIDREGACGRYVDAFEGPG